jgi:hypothetical protein
MVSERDALRCSDSELDSGIMIKIRRERDEIDSSIYTA